jgi:cob(I)alamin adenosyltransferase
VKVYTRRGDEGETDLFGGPRVSKDALRVETYGAVDELNAVLGECRARTEHGDLGGIVEHVQGLLFDLGAVLATPDAKRREKSGVPELEPGDVDELEAHIDRLEEELEPLKRVILPGGCSGAAAFHLARTVCRRAERRLVALAREEALEGPGLRYLNRLSDLLFVMARVENRRAGVADIEWAGRKR